MEKEQLSGKWKEMKGAVQKKWGEITDDELNQIEGDYTKFLGTLEKKYGDSKEKARDDLNEFIKSFKSNDSKH